MRGRLSRGGQAAVDQRRVMQPLAVAGQRDGVMAVLADIQAKNPW